MSNVSTTNDSITNDSTTNDSITNDSKPINFKPKIQNKTKTQSQRQFEHKSQNKTESQYQTTNNNRKIANNTNDLQLILHYKNYFKGSLFRKNLLFDNNYERFMCKLLTSYLYNRSVIIVGPSETLIGKKGGNWIDNHDVIVRLNRSLPLARKRDRDVGSRTDIMYNSLNTTDHPGKNLLDPNMMLNEGLRVMISPYPPINPFYKDHVAYLAQNNGVIPFRYIDRRFFSNLEKTIGCRPYTGVMAIFDLLRFPIKELHITGMDFYMYNYVREYATVSEEKLKRLRTNHIHQAEPQIRWIRKVYLSDTRLKVDSILKEILLHYYVKFDKHLTVHYNRIPWIINGEGNYPFNITNDNYAKIGYISNYDTLELIFNKKFFFQTLIIEDDLFLKVMNGNWQEIFEKLNNLKQSYKSTIVILFKKYSVITDYAKQYLQEITNKFEMDYINLANPYKTESDHHIVFRQSYVKYFQKAFKDAFTGERIKDWMTIIWYTLYKDTGLLWIDNHQKISDKYLTSYDEERLMLKYMLRMNLIRNFTSFNSNGV